MKTYDEKRQQWPVRVSPKLDGVYASATAAGITSKGGKPLRLPRIEKRLAGHFRKHPDAKIEGEVYRRGLAQEAIQSAVMRGDDGRLQLHVHPGDGPRVRAGGRVRRIAEVEAKDAAAMRREYARAVKDGNEGVVLRRGGERVKLKPFEDAEYKVARAVGGKRNVLELEGGIRVQGRAGLVAKPGQTVTVRHSGLTRKGKPKAAVAERVREIGFAEIDTAGKCMKKANRKIAGQLIELEGAFDDIIEFAANRREDDEMSTAGKVAAGTAGAGALGAAGYGAHKGRQAVINRYGVTDDYGNLVARRGMYKDAAKGLQGQAKAGVASARSGLANKAVAAGKKLGKDQKVLRKGLAGVARFVR